MTVSPVGPRERDPVLIERSNLVNISKLVVKEVNKLMMTKMQTMMMRRRMKMKMMKIFDFYLYLYLCWKYHLMTFLKVIESSLKFGRQLDSDHIPLQVFCIWYFVIGVWYLVFSIWYLVFGIWCSHPIAGVWYFVFCIL